MKKVFFPTKPFSWIQFPVTLEGYPVGKHPHLTVKFFGQADVDPHAIEKDVGPIEFDLRAEDFSWAPKFWSSPHDHANYYVLALTKYPRALDFLHGRFDILRDQYIPWTPHITVTKEFYLMVDDQGLTPEDCKLEFGEIELCLGSPSI